MTAAPVYSDGPWLRIDPTGACRGRGRRRRLAVARALLVVVVASGFTMLGLRSDPAVEPRRSVERSPSRAGAAAATHASVPRPSPDLAASFARWGDSYGLPVALLEALTWHESRWQPTAVSEAGAIGLGQLMPATAAALEAQIGDDLDPWNPDDNVRMSAHLLSTLHASSSGDLRVALAGYAQSASSVARDGMTPSTRQYVEEILALYDLFRQSA